MAVPRTASAPAAQIHEDAWLSDVLGRAAFAVVGDPEVPAAPRPALYYAKVDAADVALVRRLLTRGFAPVDVNLTLARAGTPVPESTAGVDVATARPEHAEGLLELAGGCFRYSRFHLDPLIAQEDADRVKREWVRSYLDGRRGIELLAALERGRPVGFLAVLAAGDARVIDLVGVAPHAQARGVGGALVAEFIARHGPAAAELRVGTQVANVPSLRLYERFGFRISHAAYVLHLHV